MPFVTSKTGVRFDLSRVRTFEPNETGLLILATLDDGNVFEVAEHIWASAERRSFQAVLPAMVGTFLLQPVVDTHESKLSQEPLIGWGINSSGHAVPITADGAAEDDLAVLLPTGEVVEPQVASYSSVEAYIRAKEAEPTNPFWPPNQATKAA